MGITRALATFYNFLGGMHQFNPDQASTQAAFHLNNWQLVPVLIREIDRLIVLTKSHHTNEQDSLGHIILDADLAILGVDRHRYGRYAEQIRAEYAWVELAAYQQGRFTKFPR